ncbi:hypothetical protein BSKO_01886 [Bryopsis sp. KO-2023]|nr:hypothetical protein BSKO_01886 [Bryopsis sp. KO-2023]
MSVQTAISPPCLPKKNTGFAKRNSAAALEWARQKNARIQRAKEIKADRSLSQKRRELKQLGVPGSPPTGKPESGNKDPSDVEHDPCPGNGDHTDRQSASNPGEREILSGRRASIPESNAAATSVQHPHPGFEKGATSRARESLHVVEEAQECSTLEDGEEQGETQAVEKVVRHGRRRTIPSSLENEFDEESENRERSEEVLTAVRTKVVNSRASARDSAWPAWAMIDDPIQKVRNKLHSKFGWLASARQPKPPINESDDDGQGALRDKANHCPPAYTKESCIPRIDEKTQTSPADGVVFLQTDKNPSATSQAADCVGDKDGFHRQRSARLEYLKRRSSARRLRKCMSEQQGQAAPETRLESPDDPSAQETNGGVLTGNNTRGSISLLRPPPEARTLSPRLRSQSGDGASDRSRKLSALKRQIVKSESCIASIESRARDHANDDTSSLGASRSNGDEVIFATSCRVGRTHHPVSPPGPSSISAPRARRLRRHTEENPESSCPSSLSSDAKYGQCSADVEMEFPPEAFQTSGEIKRECQSCGRKFQASSLLKHERVCTRVFKKKRKVFNSSVARLMGTGAEPYTAPQKSRRGGRAAPPQVIRTKPTHWREKSSNLRDAMMCMRGN